MKNLKITLAQINPTVGALDHNAALIKESVSKNTDADLIVFPELTLCGYSPEDLLRDRSFIDRNAELLNELAAFSKDKPAFLIGAPLLENNQLFNSAFLINDGAIHSIIKKHHLPNYGVFDEQRWFVAAPLPEPAEFKNTKLGIMICEDFWYDDAADYLKQKGATGFIAINASPFDTGKHKRRLELAGNMAKRTALPLLYCNNYGGQDDLVFDGGSFAAREDGLLIRQAAFNKEDYLTIDWNVKPIPAPDMTDRTIYDAMVLATRDYIQKNKFKSVILGLSGGIDSAIVACIAVDAIGAENVTAVMMATNYTSQISKDDAQTIAAHLNIKIYDTNISDSVTALTQLVDSTVTGKAPDVMYENLQSRLRGVLLMALSNATGAILLTTGNKSEMAMGYATLYGDMNGGFNPVKDLYKSDLYCIGKTCCADRIPDRVFTRPPSAELRPDQTDQDSLPPYDILDGILKCLLEGTMSVEETIAQGFDAALVQRIQKSLYITEYKRRQSAPGPKLTPCAFGRERRYPITNGFLPLLSKQQFV